jgi:hypothetical protein
MTSVKRKHVPVREILERVKTKSMLHSQPSGTQKWESRFKEDMATEAVYLEESNTQQEVVRRDEAALFRS